MSKPLLRQIFFVWAALCLAGLATLVAFKAAPTAPARPALPQLNRAVVEPVEEPLRLAAPIPGVVKSVAVQAGATVAAGDLLLELDDRELRGIVATQTAQLAAHEARVRAAEVQLAERAEQLRRVELLRRDQSSSEAEVQRARFAQQSADAAVAQARAELEAGRAQLGRAQSMLEMLSLRAPRAGTILQVFVQPGESATPAVAGQGLLLLGSPAPLQLRAFLSEADAVRLQRGARALARLSPGLEPALPLSLVRVVANFTPPADGPAVAQVILRAGSEPNPPLRSGQVLEISVER
ncbi:MAG: HlyD family efflux transporter periplasmic adaptor subunit [Verrucomicrobia bacterium]|nr:HlyD family efflux transporter periplasmic adaptor subunit [Verrucomicrobiota bacterium]